MLLLVCVPLAVAALFGLLTMTKKTPHPESYQLPDRWTYGPILWAATEEKIGDGHGHGHAAGELTVGGGASGKW